MKYKFFKSLLMLTLLVLLAEGIYYWRFVYPSKRLSEDAVFTVSAEKKQKAEAKVRERGLQLTELTKKQRDDEVFSTVGVVAQVEKDVFFLVTPEETLRIKTNEQTEFNQSIGEVCEPPDSTNCSRSVLGSSNEVVLKEGNQISTRLKQENGDYLGLRLTLVDE